MAHRIERADAEHDVDIGKAPAGAKQHLRQIAPVHHRIRHAKAFPDSASQGQRGQRLATAEGIKIDPGRLKATRRDRLVETELVEDASRIRTELQSGAHFLHALVSLKHNHGGAELGERQSEGQPGNAGAGDIDGSAATRHG